MKNVVNKNGNKYFRYVATVTLDHEEIGKLSEKIAKSFLDKCGCKLNK